MSRGNDRAGFVAAAFACALLAGCAAGPRVRVAASPGEIPAKSVTDFTGAR